jgi:hypothetical protein
VDGITGGENDVMTEPGFLTDRVTQAWVRAAFDVKHRVHFTAAGV